MLGRRLRLLRNEALLTRKAVAAILKVHETSYGKYELDERAPDLTMLIRLADLYKVNSDFLLGRDLIYLNEQDISEVLKEARKNRRMSLSEVCSELAKHNILLEPSQLEQHEENGNPPIDAYNALGIIYEIEGIITALGLHRKGYPFATAPLVSYDNDAYLDTDCEHLEDMFGIYANSNSDIKLTLHERKLITAYRSNVDMQDAVDRLLNIEADLHIKKHATA